MPGVDWPIGNNPLIMIAYSPSVVLEQTKQMIDALVKQYVEKVQRRTIPNLQTDFIVPVTDAITSDSILRHLDHRNKLYRDVQRYFKQRLDELKRSTHYV